MKRPWFMVVLETAASKLLHLDHLEHGCRPTEIFTSAASLSADLDSGRHDDIAHGTPSWPLVLLTTSNTTAGAPSPTKAHISSRRR
jgi:hypothetical protein